MPLPAGPTNSSIAPGSRIPIRDATPMTKEEKERQAQESQPAPQQMQSTGAGNPRNN